MDIRAVALLCAVSLALASTACDPATPPAAPGAASPVPSAASAPSPSGAGSQEGGECGDDVAIQKKCAAGLVCAPSTKGPVSEHTPGTCKKP